MADEIDKGQEVGEVRGPGGNVRSPDIENTATYESLGISRQHVSEWREIRDAGPEAVEAAIMAALGDGRPPTKADIQNHVRGTEGTGEFERYTPAEYIASARSVLGAIDLDPASNAQAQRIVKAARYLTIEDDGLAHPWSELEPRLNLVNDR